MRAVPVLALLTTLACQPQAPRLALERAVYRRSTAAGATTTREYRYTYGDGALIGGKPLDRGELVVTRSGVDGSDRADIDYTYSEERLTRYDQRADNDEFDSVGQFLYRPNGKLQKIETDSGASSEVEVNLEVSYDADDQRLLQLAYKWAFWIFRVNERADVRYDADGRIHELDGGDLFVRYEWSEGQLGRVEVQQEDGEDMDYRLSYTDGKLTGVVDDDDRWTLSYDDQGRLAHIEAEIGDVEESAEYTYADHTLLNVRVAPRLPLYVNFVFGLDGRALPDLDLLALPDYFN